MLSRQDSPLIVCAVTDGGLLKVYRHEQWGLARGQGFARPLVRVDRLAFVCTVLDSRLLRNFEHKRWVVNRSMYQGVGSRACAFAPWRAHSASGVAAAAVIEELRQLRAPPSSAAFDDRMSTTDCKAVSTKRSAGRSHVHCTCTWHDIQLCSQT